jgi:4-amino-4-deoxy-L-arabinose transferase-like glycosyltransferase
LRKKTAWQASQWMLLLVILLGWALALSRLGERSLWADEGATAYQAQKLYSWAQVANWHKDYSFLHLPLMMVIVRLSHHEMTLRLPSAAAAVLTLPVVYALGRKLLGQVAGLVAAFLLAISPFALRYAQEARVYALFELLACLSLLFLLLALERRSWLRWVGFVVTTALLLYTHLFAWFVVSAEILWAIVMLVRKSWTRRRLDLRLLWLAACLLAIAALYWPLVQSLLTFWQQYGSSGSASQHAGLPTFQFSFGFFILVAGVFGAQAPGLGWQFYLFVGSILLGLVSLLVQKKWGTLLLIALWFGLPVAALAIVSSQHFFDYRYLIFLLPPFLLLTAKGVTGVTAVLAKGRWLSRFPQAHTILGLGLACLLFLPANLPALREYSHWEKENWRGIGVFVRDHLQPDEAIFVAPHFWAFPLLFYQPSLEPHLAGGDSVDQLRDVAQQHAGVWYLRFGGPLADPAGEITAWITEQQFELLVDVWACGQGVLVYYRRFDDLTTVRQAELLRAAAEFCPTDPRFQPPSE